MCGNNPSQRLKNALTQFQTLKTLKKSTYSNKSLTNHDLHKDLLQMFKVRLFGIIVIQQLQLLSLDSRGREIGEGIESDWYVVKN